MFASVMDEAKILIMRQDYAAAIPKLTEHLNGNFWDDEALFMLGGCFSAQGWHGLSVVLSTAAIQARAQGKGQPFPRALLNLGVAYRAEHHEAMAEKYWLEALKYERDAKERATLLSNISTLYLQRGAPEEAIKYADQAIGEDPKFPNSYANRGLACLEMGRWVEGWEGWKYTHATGDRPKRTYAGIPDWDGTPGQTVIVSGDQGIGDEIFFASALSDMQRVCKKVILDCHPRLPALFKRSFPEVEVHGTRKDLTDLPWFEGCGADAAVMLSDLFAFFRNKDGDWTGQPYLKAERAVNLADTMRREGGIAPLRIGLSWTGGTKATHQHRRTIPIDLLEPILQARPDAKWFSLQYTPDAARQVCEVEERTGIRIAHYPGQVEHYDYDRTASFVASLDLVITVPTTVHHLAGALGVPNWMLVHSRPDWRCQVKGETLPWYNSTRLYRQTIDGDWQDPISRVASDLGSFQP